MAANKPYDITPMPQEPTEEGLINPIIFNRPDMCPNCKSQKVELMSFNNYPQGYGWAVDAYLSGYSVSFDKYEIRSMRCKSCTKEFVIDWTYGFPKPLRDTDKSNIFFMEFLAGI
jgi:hypothetical protein